MHLLATLHNPIMLASFHIFLMQLSPNMVMMGFKRDWMRNSAECRQYVDILFAGFRHNLSIGILRVKQGFDYSKIIASEEVGRFRVFHQLAGLGWVGFDLGSSSVCPISDYLISDIYCMETFFSVPRLSPKRRTRRPRREP